MQAASVAEFKALTLTSIGSQTKAAKLSQIPSLLLTPTPKYFPLPSYKLCFYLKFVKTATESKPALSAMVLGITSKALAKALTMYYSLPEI